MLKNHGPEQALTARQCERTSVSPSPVPRLVERDAVAIDVDDGTVRGGRKADQVLAALEGSGASRNDVREPPVRRYRTTTASGSARPASADRRTGH